MNNAVYMFELPKNEPIKEYRVGSPERKELQEKLELPKKHQKHLKFLY